MSALAKTSFTGARVAPAALYSLSLKPEPTPAPASTMTVWPAATKSLTPFGVMPTRYSSFLISLGQPTIMTPPRSSPD